MPVADAEGQHEGAARRPFRRNPFALALLAAGFLMLIVGVWLVEQSVSLAATYEQVAVFQAESQLAAPLMSGGVIAIVAWLVLGTFAVSADRRGA